MCSLPPVSLFLQYPYTLSGYYPSAVLDNRDPAPLQAATSEEQLARIHGRLAYLQ
jgi:hypothetical protein